MCLAGRSTAFLGAPVCRDPVPPCPSSEAMEEMWDLHARAECLFSTLDEPTGSIVLVQYFSNFSNMKILPLSGRGKNVFGSCSTLQGAKLPTGLFPLLGVGGDIGICDSGICDIAFFSPVDCARLRCSQAWHYRPHQQFC